MKYFKIDTDFNTKYASKNPIIVFLNHYFFSSLSGLVRDIGTINLLDAGCGEGLVINFLSINNVTDEKKIIALDIEPERLKLARSINPKIKFCQGSIYQLPYQNNSFDMVMAIEILEHLVCPEKALSEIKRVSKKWVLISVPNDRIFRLGNMLRFKYISDWGNPPDHVQHWNRRSFEEFVSTYLRIISVHTILNIWLVFICEAK